MSLFYVKDGAPFIPEAINPELVKLAKAIVKTCRLTFKFQIKTTSLKNAIAAGKKDQMAELLQKCLEKNRKQYDTDMALAGVKVGAAEDGFFEDKDEAFFKNQLTVLMDFAYINTVIDAKMFPLMAAACEKTLHKKISELLFFTNQTEILNVEEAEEALENGEADEV